MVTIAWCSLAEIKAQSQRSRSLEKFQGCREWWDSSWLGDGIFPRISCPHPTCQKALPPLPAHNTCVYSSVLVVTQQHEHMQKIKLGDLEVSKKTLRVSEIPLLLLVNQNCGLVDFSSVEPISSADKILIFNICSSSSQKEKAIQGNKGQESTCIDKIGKFCNFVLGSKLKKTLHIWK